MRSPLKYTIAHSKFKRSKRICTLRLRRSRGASKRVFLSVVGQHGSVLLDNEQLVVHVTWRQKTNAWQIEPKAVDGAHAERAVLALVVLVFYPRREGSVERFDAR